MNWNKTDVAGKKKSEGIRMGYGLAFQLFYVVAFRAPFLEHGKCQVLYLVIPPVDFGLANLNKLTTQSLSGPHDVSVLSCIRF